METDRRPVRRSRSTRSSRQRASGLGLTRSSTSGRSAYPPRGDSWLGCIGYERRRGTPRGHPRRRGRDRRTRVARSVRRAAWTPNCSSDRPSPLRSCRIVSAVSTLDPASFFIAVALAAAISTGVFVHASKHGSSHATAWGIAAFLAAGVAVPVYFIRHWMRRGARD